MTADISKHQLVPEHTLLSDSEKEKLIKKLNIMISSLPRILVTDPAIIELNTKSGDVIKIERDSETSGRTIYYRVVIEG